MVNVNVVLYDNRAGEMEHIAETYIYLEDMNDEAIKAIESIDYNDVTNDNEMYDKFLNMDYSVFPSEVEFTKLIEVYKK